MAKNHFTAAFTSYVSVACWKMYGFTGSLSLYFGFLSKQIPVIAWYKSTSSVTHCELFTARVCAVFNICLIPVLCHSDWNIASGKFLELSKVIVEFVNFDPKYHKRCSWKIFEIISTMWQTLYAEATWQ